MRLDLYATTPSAEPRPAVILVHGGGWRKGDKGDIPVGNLAHWFAEEGTVAISINYRLSGTESAPAAVEDCKCAVRWLRAHARDLGVDTSRLLAAGGSAGGHLALMLGLSHDPHLEGNGGWSHESSTVNAVISYAGITDAEDLLYGPNQRDFAVAWLPERLHRRQETAAFVSPINHVSRSTSPVLFVHGNQDTTVPLEHSVRLHKALIEAGVDSSLLTIDGAGHGLKRLFAKEFHSKICTAQKAFMSAIEFTDT